MSRYMNECISARDKLSKFISRLDNKDAEVKSCPI